MLTVSAVVAMRILIEKPSCTGAVRCVLYGSEIPLTLSELQLALGYRWPRYQVSSVLAKLRDAGEVVDFPPIEGKRKGKRYAHVQTDAIRRRSEARIDAAGARRRALDALAPSLCRRAGCWDGLVPAPAPCHA